MKCSLIRTSLIGLSIALLSPLAAGSQDKIQMPIADGTNIVVHYTELLQPLPMGGIYPEGAATDRLYSFSQVFKSAFVDSALPPKVDVVCRGSRKNGDLNITVMINRWDLNSMGEYECRFTATVSNGVEKINLGVFVGLFNELTIHRGSSSEFTYDVAARRAADKMVSHFIRA